MLSEKDLLDSLKKEIKDYLALLNSIKVLPNQNDITFIGKLILFLKKLFSNSPNSYYKNFIIYNLLMLMHSLTQNSVINFYQIYRAFIENFIRSMLDLNDNDSTGVNKLFKEFETKFSLSNETITIINYIKGEYSKACDFVHSNVNANIPVYEYYKDIITTDEMNDKILKSLISKVLTLLKFCTTFIILISPNKIDISFYKNNYKLKFLIGDNLFLKFQDNIKIWENN